MAGFKEFGEYMFSLLFTPLRKGIKAANQFYIFFKVVGKLFDDTKRDIFRVRAESMVISASEVMLLEHGKDRDMPRLKGEDIEAYRTRLSMKAIIAEQAGTREGVLLALKALGYEHSYIEPFYKTDPERWAEFIVFLRGKNPSGVNDIRIIDTEVMKVKEASAKPSYGIEEYTQVDTRSEFKGGLYKYPICNNFLCGVWPFNNDNVGYLLKTGLNQESTYRESNFPYPLTGKIAASEKLYQETDFLQCNHDSSVIGAEIEFKGNSVNYPFCNQIRAGEYPN